MKIVARPGKTIAGIMLIECVAYIAILAVIMGLSYGAYYRTVASSSGMRRNAADITKALQCGERWRDDVRNATGDLSVSQTDQRQVVSIPQKSGEVIYSFENGAIQRSSDGKTWNPILRNVKASQIYQDKRKQGVAWRWEVELNSVKKAKVRPLFTFQAVTAKK